MQLGLHWTSRWLRWTFSLASQARSAGAVDSANKGSRAPRWSCTKSVYAVSVELSVQRFKFEGSRDLALTGVNGCPGIGWQLRVASRGTNE